MKEEIDRGKNPRENDCETAAKKAAARAVKARKGYSRRWAMDGQPLIPTIFTAATVLEVSLN